VFAVLNANCQLVSLVSPITPSSSQSNIFFGWDFSFTPQEFVMSGTDLDREVAQATGEDLRTIRRRGFQLANPLVVCFDPEPDDLDIQVYDWDQQSARPLRLVA
jgi:hypothetical protein